jgi:hypothetical protein
MAYTRQLRCAMEYAYEYFPNVFYDFAYLIGLDVPFNADINLWLKS